MHTRTRVSVSITMHTFTLTSPTPHPPPTPTALLLGDLNYRVVGPPPEVLALIAHSARLSQAFTHARLLRPSSSAAPANKPSWRDAAFAHFLLSSHGQGHLAAARALPLLSSYGEKQRRRRRRVVRVGKEESDDDGAASSCSSSGSSGSSSNLSSASSFSATGEGDGEGMMARIRQRLSEQQRREAVEGDSGLELLQGPTSPSSLAVAAAEVRKDRERGGDTWV